MQLETFLEQSAATWPEKTALICGLKRLSYAELEARCNRLAHGLMAQGVRRGDRVVVHLDNGVEAVVSLFAILKAGAVFSLVNPTTKPDKLAYILDDAEARAVILPGTKLASLDAHWRHMPSLTCVIATPPAMGEPGVSDPEKTCVSYEQLARRHADDTSPPTKRAIDIDLAALIYTSGSTGNPKGVMLTHRNMVAAATSITTYLENRHDDVIMNVLPLSFDYGLYQLLMAMKFGGTLVLEKSFTYPHAMMQRLVQEAVTGLPLVPTLAAILLRMDLAEYDLSHLRYVTNTGAALPIEHIRRLREALPHVRIYSMYGLTECKRVAYLPPEQIDVRPGSVGRAMPNTETFLVDDDGRRLGPGEVGELVVRGGNVMVGYWELPEQTQQMLKPGLLPGEKVLHTGDLFRMDDEGYLYFVGRKDDIIKSRGEKVSPKEVENVLCAHPGIAEAAVVGVPDEILGQAVHAVVAAKADWELTEREVLRFCADHLEDFMVPRSVEIRDELPRTGNGKIDKKDLAKAVS